MFPRKLTLFAMVLVLLVLGMACTQGRSTTPTPAGAAGGAGGLPPGTTRAEAPGVAALPAFQPNYGAQQSGIWVSGSGKVAVVPDLTLVSLGAEARAVSVRQARDEAASAMEQMMGVLESSGIQKKDIKTQFFNIQPEYVWNDFAKRQEIKGYRVTNTISVKVRNLEGLGALLDRVADAGGDLVRINDISFTVENPEKLAAQAREAAVKDALAKAQQFANLTGVTLGKLVYISESGASIPLVRDYAEAKAVVALSAPTTPIAPGELDVTIAVQAVFGIE